MGENLDLLFLGGLFPRDKEKEIYEKSKSYVESAANAMQWNLVEGFDRNCSRPVKILNSLYIGSYPANYRDLCIKTYPFQHCPGAEDINAGFLNLFIVKHIFKYWALKPYLKKWAREQAENKIIVGYALLGVTVKAMAYIKSIDPQIKTCVIVPDIPQYMNTDSKRSLLYTFLKDMEIYIIKKHSPSIDAYVLLTKYMKEFIPDNKNFVVVEGISTDAFQNIEAQEDNENKVILYTGTLNRRYGVMNLVQAFKQIKGSDYRLVLCGSGDAEKEIIKEALADERILFKGKRKWEEILKLQMEATVLVNPRQNNEVFTKYSFPSKILEYLSSGTPVIAYKLEGMPDECDDYIHYLGSDTVEALAEKLREVCEKDRQERLLFGEKAREFVLREKNNQVQTEKIINMMLSV